MTIALLWGFSEATLFFLVPDVYLSRIALTHPRRAFVACLWALAGSLVGGALMLAWGAGAPGAAEATIEWVPAVAPEMIERVRGELATSGVAATFRGPLLGTPYKIYAVEAGRLGLSPAAFLAVSVPARLVRFVLVTALAAWIAGALGRRGWQARRLRRVHAAAWGLFYAVYFAAMPW